MTNNLILRTFINFYKEEKNNEELKRIMQPYSQIILFLELDYSLKYKEEKEGRTITKNNEIIFKNNLILWTRKFLDISNIILRQFFEERRKRMKKN